MDVSSARFTRPSGERGGAGTSIDNNNVFTIQPTVYFEGMDPTKESASLLQDGPTQAGINPAVALASTVGLGAVAVAGTALCILNENWTALGVFWVALGGATAFAAYQYLNGQDKAAKQ